MSKNIKKPKIRMTSRNLALICLALVLQCKAELKAAVADTTHPKRQALVQALNRGIEVLKKQQGPDGAWAPVEQPAITAIVLSACLREPSGELARQQPEFVRKGCERILRSQHPDGSIFYTNYPTYSTATAIIAL